MYDFNIFFAAKKSENRAVYNNISKNKLLEDISICGRPTQKESQIMGSLHILQLMIIYAEILKTMHSEVARKVRL
jgi:hypothetical protein